MMLMIIFHEILFLPRCFASTLFSVLNLYYKVQFCLSECLCAYLSVLTPLKSLEVQASNLARLITNPGECHKGRVANRPLFQRTVLYLNPPSLSFIKLRIVLYF